MKAVLLASMAICAQASLGLGIQQFDGATGSDRPYRNDGPSLPGNADCWTTLVRNSGPTGSCPDPNPSTSDMPHGVIILVDHTAQPNGPDRPFPRSKLQEGPQGMPDGYYVSMTNDHHSGPRG